MHESIDFMQRNSSA